MLPQSAFVPMHAPDPATGLLDNSIAAQIALALLHQGIANLLQNAGDAIVVTTEIVHSPRATASQPRTQQEGRR